jgi:hypothetical protein
MLTFRGYYYVYNSITHHCLRLVPDFNVGFYLEMMPEGYWDSLVAAWDKDEPIPN